MITGLVTTGIGFFLGKYYGDETVSVLKRCGEGAVITGKKIQDAFTKK